MRSFALAGFIPIRTVFDERHSHGGYAAHEFEEREIGLYIREREYYLLYWYDPLPGGYGEKRCEGIVHITQAEREQDNEYLKQLYFSTRMEHLIDISMFQKERTVTCLTAAHCADRICVVWCASTSHTDRHAGCIEFTKDEMDSLTESRLIHVLKKFIPEGTVIPPFRLYPKEN